MVLKLKWFQNFICDIPWCCNCQWNACQSNSDPSVDSAKLWIWVLGSFVRAYLQLLNYIQLKCKDTNSNLKVEGWNWKIVMKWTFWVGPRKETEDGKWMSMGLEIISSIIFLCILHIRHICNMSLITRRTFSWMDYERHLVCTYVKNYPIRWSHEISLSWRVYFTYHVRNVSWDTVKNYSLREGSIDSLITISS